MVGLIYFIRVISERETDRDPIIELEESYKSADKTLYFLGSSRIRASVVPNLISEATNQPAVNLGLSSNTFIGSLIIADYLLEQPGEKVIIIEISSLRMFLKEGYRTFERQININTYQRFINLTPNLPFTKRWKLFLDMVYSDFFDILSIRLDLRNLLIPKNDNKWIGYNPQYKNEETETKSFITFEEIQLKRSPNAAEDHLILIESLQQKASKNGSKIFFLLPITFRHAREVPQNTGVFQALPDSAKVHYSREFLGSISKSKYLRDKNHLNAYGAEKYSEYLANQISNYLLP